MAQYFKSDEVLQIKMGIKMKNILSVFAMAVASKFKNLDGTMLGEAPSRTIVKNPYPVARGEIVHMRDITPLTNFNNRSHTAHQGKQECARRVRQMANGSDCGQFNV